MMELTTVGELINYLGNFKKDIPLIVNVDGNTFHPDTDDIGLWDDSDDDSALEIRCSHWCE